MDARPLAVVAVEPRIKAGKERKAPRPLAKVVITPCDPWPRPYYFENGLRKLRPYHFTYNTYCKQRWRGRELLDIFIDEFRDRPAEYYVCRILDLDLDVYPNQRADPFSSRRMPSYGAPSWSMASLSSLHRPSSTTEISSLTHYIVTSHR